MKKRYALGIVCIFIIILLGITYRNRAYKIPSTYINAIDKVYNSNIDGMAVTTCSTNNLYGLDAQILRSETGNKENNFSESSKAGVRLQEAKQLFLSIKNLKILREGLPEILEPQEKEYYVIQTNLDYVIKESSDNIYYLTMYVNYKNYHIFIPKDYYEPDKLQKLSTKYVEYEPNEITKKLINDIIKP